MSGPSKVIVLEPDPRAGRQVQLGFEREGVATSLELAADAGLVMVGGADGEAVDLVKKARAFLAAQNLDVPVIAASRGASRTQLEAAGADEVLARPAYLRDVVTVGRILHGVPATKRDHLVGNLVDTTGVYNLVRALSALGRSAVLTLIRGLRRGEVRFYRGEVTSAEVGLIHGQAALHQLLLWTDARFDFSHEDIVRRQQIPLAPEELFADAERFLEGVREHAGELSPATVLEQDAQRVLALGKQVPTEVHGVLRMFDGHRVLSDILEDSPYRVFETLRVTQKAVEVGLLKVLDAQRAKATWRTVLSIDEWLVGNETRDAVVERMAEHESQPVSKKSGKGKGRRKPRAAAPPADTKAEIDWGALVPRVIGAEVGPLAGVVPAQAAHGEMELPTRAHAREKLEALMDTDKRDKIFATDIGLEPSIVVSGEDTDEWEQVELEARQRIAEEKAKAESARVAKEIAEADTKSGSSRRRKRREAEAKAEAAKAGDAAKKANEAAKAAADLLVAADAKVKADAAKTAKSDADAKAKSDAGAKAKADADAKANADADAKAKVDANAKAKSDADSKAKADADAKAKADADAKAKVDADAKAKADADAKAKADADAKAKVDADAKAKADADAKAKADAEVKAKADADAKAKADAEARAKADVEVKAKADADAKAKADADARAKADAEVKAKADADAKAKADAEARAKADTAKAEAEAKAKADSEARAKADAAKAEAEAKAKADAEAKAKADAEAKAKADAEAKAKADAEAKAKADAEAKAKADADAKAKADAEAKANADADAKAKADTEAKAKADAEAKAKADAEAKAKADAEAKARADAARASDHVRAYDKVDVIDAELATATVPETVERSLDRIARAAAETTASDAAVKRTAAEEARSYAARVKAAAESKRHEEHQNANPDAIIAAGHESRTAPPAGTETDRAAASMIATPTGADVVAGPPDRPSGAANLVRQLVSEGVPAATGETSSAAVTARVRADEVDAVTTPFIRPEPEVGIGAPITVAEGARTSVSVTDVVTVNRSVDTSHVVASPRVLISETPSSSAVASTAPALTASSVPAPPVIGSGPVSNAEPNPIDDEPSDGVIRSMIATADTARLARQRQMRLSTPEHDGPAVKETTGEIRGKSEEKTAPQNEPATSEPSILVADLAAAHTAIAAVTAHPAPPPPTDAASSSRELEVSDVRKDAVAFTEHDEAFFKKAESHSVMVPKIESFDDLDEGYEPPKFWDRVFGRKKPPTK